MLAILLALVHGIVLSSSFNGWQLVGLVLVILMVIGGSQEITSQHLRRVRYLPWVMAFLTASVIVAIVVPLVERPAYRAYPASVRAGLMNGCEAHGGDAAYCGCVLSWFESNRSFGQYLAEFTSTATEASRADMSEATASCTSQKSSAPARLRSERSLRNA
jgi:hypothetical protein